MAWIGVLVALAVIGTVFLDAFEAMILPRRIRHSYRLARAFYRSSWRLWKVLAHKIPAGQRRNSYLSTFGPLSMFALIVVWALGLIGGFALVHWCLGTELAVAGGGEGRFGTYFYFSGTTFFTLGYGDLVPLSGWGRTLSVVEAGIGFGFLAVVISYLPVLYQAFSRREIAISLLDARAGSPPSAGEFLRRAAEAHNLGAIRPLLAEWERWSAELLESHLSFPVLRFYRSQHDNQSWVAALTAILDSTAFLIANAEGPERYQARLTFAMARHAAVDLILVSQIPPLPPDWDRLPAAELARLRDDLRAAGHPLREATAMAKTLAELRALYEPFVHSLSEDLLFALPPFASATRPMDNWQTSPGMQPSPGLVDLQAIGARDEHFR